jgi:hypothetical protein
MGASRWVYTSCLVLAGCGAGSEGEAARDAAADPFTSFDARVDAASNARDASMPRDLTDHAFVDASRADHEPRSEAGSTERSDDGAAAAALFGDAGEAGAAPVQVADAGPERDTGSVQPPPTAGCLEGITDYKNKGKFPFTYEAIDETDESTQQRINVKMWVPTVPAGCKVPVVHFSNGTGATCASYRAIHEHLASHGFLSTCYETTNSNEQEGARCISALETAYRKHPGLADDKIASGGHGVGGAAAHRCLQHAEVRWGRSKRYAGYALAPESGSGSDSGWMVAYAKIVSPMLEINCTADNLVSASWVGRAFDALPDATEAYWYEAQGATHVPIPVTWTQESAVVFFRWKLLGDARACQYFKAMPMGPDWKLQKQQADQGC